MMTTTTNATTTRTILALDLGKYKSVACLYQRDTAEYAFHSLDTCCDNLRCLLQRHRPALVVFEACALAGWVRDLCTELALPCKVANTASEAWKFKYSKRKTDKDDALRLAQLQALGQLPIVVIPPKQTRPWRGLIACRQHLVGRRVALQNRIRVLLVGQGLPAPRGHRAWTETGLQDITRRACPLAECGPEELWRGLLELALTEYRQTLALLKQTETRLDALAGADASVRIQESIPGVGARTAEVVVALASPSASRRPSESAPMAGWCRDNTSRARVIGVDASASNGLALGAVYHAIIKPARRIDPLNSVVVRPALPADGAAPSPH